MFSIQPSTTDTQITRRHSVRAYKSDSVSSELLRRLLEMAAHAPSTTNSQPWKSYVLTGDSLKNLTHAVCTAFDTEPDEHHAGIPRYYPDPPLEPYLSRRRKIGQNMYRLLDIAREDS